jgi:hypothetical protein
MKAANLHDEIAMVARELYENSGCSECRDLANWLEAERIVLVRHASQEMEEPEETGLEEEAEERELPRTEGYPANQEMEESEGPTVMEEIEVKASTVAPRRGRGFIELLGKRVSAQKSKAGERSPVKKKRAIEATV